jgi:hypothetical protein
MKFCLVVRAHSPCAQPLRTKQCWWLRLCVVAVHTKTFTDRLYICVQAQTEAQQTSIAAFHDLAVQVIQ